MPATARLKAEPDGNKPMRVLIVQAEATLAANCTMGSWTAMRFVQLASLIWMTSGQLRKNQSRNSKTRCASIFASAAIIAACSSR